MSVLIILVNVLTSLGQLFQKQAAESWRLVPVSLFKKLSDKYFLLSIASLGFAMLLWLVVLHSTPLSTAYPMLSLNFVFVTLVARFWFKEQIGWKNWLGIVCIVAGVICMGLAK